VKVRFPSNEFDGEADERGLAVACGQALSIAHCLEQSFSSSCSFSFSISSSIPIRKKFLSCV